MIVEFNNVCKSYENLDVLESLSFSVKEQDIVGILGPSGVGKSTILKLIAGLETADAGTITNSARKIGYVFQEPRILPWKTALDNVAIPLMAQGFKKKEARIKAAGCLEKMGLHGFEEYFPAQLSGGMIQRISLARAFSIEPDIMLMDEPFSALDVRLKEVMLNLLKERLEEKRIPVIYVSHSPEEVVQIATRIFMLFSKGVMEELPVDEDDSFKDFLKDAFLITV